MPQHTPESWPTTWLCHCGSIKWALLILYNGINRVIVFSDVLRISFCLFSWPRASLPFFCFFFQHGCWNAQLFCSISVFCHGCLKNCRTPLGYNKMNRLRGGSVMSLFSSSGSCTCHNYWLHRALTWIKSVIFHWWMTCWLHATHHFPCPPYLLFTLSVPLFLSLALCCCLALFFFMIYDGATHPLLPFTPESNAMAWPAALSKDWRRLLPKWCHPSMSFIYPQ